MDIFIKEIKGLYNNSINYVDTESLYLEEKNWDVLDKTNLVGKNLCQVKNGYETGGIFHGLFLVLKIMFN